MFFFSIFQSLALDKSPSVPYSRDIADQRRKYGDSVLRRCDEHLASQKQHETETQTKLEEARRKRQEEKAQLEALEVSTFESVFGQPLTSPSFRNVERAS